MPLLDSSAYHPPGFLRSGHLQTLLPTLFRKLPHPGYARERIETPDGDFIDLDWLRTTHPDRLVVISHGLEGNSHQNYVVGMAGAFRDAGWNVLAWNFRGCSGEENRKLQTYHSGATHDLETVLRHAMQSERCSTVALVGFSLGGNLTLKYLGDRGAELDSRIRVAVGISVPCELEDSAIRLERRENRLYMARFMRLLRQKIHRKALHFPYEIDPHPFMRMTTFREFDDAYTAPVHGFASAEDYWHRCSCNRVINRIVVPTLLLNARDDPFLTPSCYPRDTATESAFLTLDMPEHGGHVGFMSPPGSRYHWSELRAVAFCCHAEAGK